ncbi:hypothetical protein ACTFIY_011891 [Dictyostelium cf. discoideum]
MPYRGYSSPAYYLPEDHPLLVREFRRLNYQRTQLSKFAKECTQEQAMNNALIHGSNDGIKCKESLYPLNFIQLGAQQDTKQAVEPFDGGFINEPDDFIEDAEDIIEQLH